MTMNTTTMDASLLNGTSIIDAQLTTTTPNPNADNIVYILGITKIISLTMIRVVSKCVISFIGIVLNVNLVYVTYRTKALHGSSNLLIALNSFFTAIYEFSYVIEFYVNINKLIPYPLGTCFWLQLLPLFATNCTMGFMLFVGIDRLIVTAWPTRHKRIRLGSYLMFGTAVCWLYAMYVVAASYLMVFPLYETKGVGCQLADLYQDTAVDIIVRNNIILNVMTIACYLAVWVLIKRRKTGVSNRLFKSLTMIMLSVLLGWFLYSVSILAIDLFALSTTYKWYVLFLTGIVMSAADGSHAVILYTFSNQYRRIFQNQMRAIARLFCCICMWKKGKTHAVTIRVSQFNASSETKAPVFVDRKIKPHAHLTASHTTIF